MALTRYLETVLIDAEVTEPRVSPRLIVVTRAALAVLWLVWAAMAWWSLPRAATLQQLEHDFAAGRIASFTRADSWEYPRVWAWPIRIQFGAEDGMLIWNTSDGRTRYATPDFTRDPNELATSTSGRIIGEDNETTRWARRLDLAGIPRGVTSPAGQATQVVAFLLLLAGVGILIGGPAPVRGTRWFWFWIGQVPLGLGYLAWLASERPWTEPKPREKRQTGWFGFALLVVASIVISIVAYQVNKLLGQGTIPFS